MPRRRPRLRNTGRSGSGKPSVAARTGGWCTIGDVGFQAWGCSAVGSALRSHRRGREFDSPQLHSVMRGNRCPCPIGLLIDLSIFFTCPGGFYAADMRIGHRHCFARTWCYNDYCHSDRLWLRTQNSNKVYSKAGNVRESFRRNDAHSGGHHHNHDDFSSPRIYSLPHPPQPFSLPIFRLYFRRIL